MRFSSAFVGERFASRKPTWKPRLYGSGCGLASSPISLTRVMMAAINGMRAIILSMSYVRRLSGPGVLMLWGWVAYHWYGSQSVTPMTSLRSTIWLAVFLDFGASVRPRALTRSSPPALDAMPSLIPPIVVDTARPIAEPTPRVSRSAPRLMLSRIPTVSLPVGSP